MPAFCVQEFAPKRTRYVLCVPVIDEGERIARQLAKSADIARTIDLVIADGGSRDGSLAEERLRAANVRALLTKTGAGKLSAQMRMAIAWGLDQGYEGFVFMDGNDKDDPADIAGFVRALDAGFDHVQGSRYMPGGRGVRTPLSRKLGVRFLHAPLLSLAAGFRYTDTTNGCRGYSRRFLTDPRVQPLRDVFQAYELHYYLAVRAARLGFRVTELPVSRTYPAGERTPTKISPIRGNARIFMTLMRAVFQRYNPPESP
ncbi:MAG: glycosyltransferase family 2 protein [Planctomycetes bacterium]|nr:glycosyltransferase family 2 protein [Planctomycetota bacterium]